MTRDYRIRISRGDTGLKFVLESPLLGAAGIELQRRDPWQSNATVSDQLRLGSAPIALLQQVQAQVSKWVLLPDLYPLLTAQIANGPDPLRLIWQIDSEVRPDLSEVPFEAITPSGGPLPYVTLPQIAGFTHLLPKTGATPATAKGCGLSLAPVDEGVPVGVTAPVETVVVEPDAVDPVLGRSVSEQAAASTAAAARVR